MPVTIVAVTRGRAVAVAALVAALATACSSSPSAPSARTDGPLSSNLVPSEVCVPADQVPVLTGAGLLTSSQDGVRITSVSFTDGPGPVVGAAYLLPDTQRSAIGVLSDPPAVDVLDQYGLTEQWTARRDAAGATVGTSPVQLVVSVAAGSKPGTASGIRIAYQADGQDYELTMPQRTKVASGSC